MATLYLRHGDWAQTKLAVLAGNIFRQSKATSLNRLEREFRLRLKTLTPDQLQLLVDDPSSAKIPISLLAVIDEAPSLLRPFLQA